MGFLSLESGTACEELTVLPLLSDSLAIGAAAAWLRLADSLPSTSSFLLGRTLTAGMALDPGTRAKHDCLFVETPQDWGTVGEQMEWGYLRSTLLLGQLDACREGWGSLTGSCGLLLNTLRFPCRNPHAGDGLHGCGQQAIPGYQTQ